MSGGSAWHYRARLTLTCIDSWILRVARRKHAHDNKKGSNGRILPPYNLLLISLAVSPGHLPEGNGADAGSARLDGLFETGRRQTALRGSLTRTVHSAACGSSGTSSITLSLYVLTDLPG